MFPRNNEFIDCIAVAHVVVRAAVFAMHRSRLSFVFVTGDTHVIGFI
jgi:hypothetical protein